MSFWAEGVWESTEARTSLIVWKQSLQKEPWHHTLLQELRTREDRLLFLLLRSRHQDKSSQERHCHRPSYVPSVLRTYLVLYGHYPFFSLFVFRFLSAMYIYECSFSILFISLIHRPQALSLNGQKEKFSSVTDSINFLEQRLVIRTWFYMAYELRIVFTFLDG